jgi:hypothetical protein
MSGTYSNAPCTEEGYKNLPLHLAILEEFYLEYISVELVKKFNSFKT